jgi:hypothetical protein
MTKSSCSLCLPINIQQSTNNGDHNGWEMEGCMREVRGLGEDGEWGEEHNDGKNDDDNDAMTMDDDDAASPSPSQLPSPLPS